MNYYFQVSGNLYEAKITQNTSDLAPLKEMILTPSLEYCHVPSPDRAFHDGCHVIHGGLTWATRKEYFAAKNHGQKKHPRFPIVYQGKHDTE